MTDSLAAQILATLGASKRYLVSAESLTGGLLSSGFVDIPGASDVFLGSIVAYRTDLKTAWLGVDQALLESKGPIDADVARQMAIGAAARACADLNIELGQIVAIATTGVAGPSEQNGQPAGKAFIAVAIGLNVAVRELKLAGTRQEIRLSTCQLAMQLAWEQITKS